MDERTQREKDQRTYSLFLPIQKKHIKDDEKRERTHRWRLFCLDILTVLYSQILHHDPKDPAWADRDRFILSAGHKCLALYTTLADQGYFVEDILYTYNTFDTKVPMHPDEKALAGVEFPTGSLGHGLSVGAVISLAVKLLQKDCRVFAVLGDGETLRRLRMGSCHVQCP